jgi:hypothetical protein
MLLNSFERMMQTIAFSDNPIACYVQKEGGHRL